MKTTAEDRQYVLQALKERLVDYPVTIAIVTEKDIHPKEFIAIIPGDDLGNLKGRWMMGVLVAKNDKSPARNIRIMGKGHEWMNLQEYGPFLQKGYRKLWRDLIVDATVQSVERIFRKEDRGDAGTDEADEG